jgi:cobalt/nickel transport system permease protein
MIDELFAIEQEAYRDSFVHRLDARVKIIITIAAIIAIVAFPFESDVYLATAGFLLLLLILFSLSQTSIRTYILRLAMILPFGFFIIIAQIFFENPRYTECTVLVDLPLGVAIYHESLLFALMLSAKFLVCVSFIILLSGTTRMHDLLEGAARLGLPAEFSLILGMMIRYLFVFAVIYRHIQNALATRCFNALNRNLPYRYRLSTIAYTIGTLFLRSFEQGERTYMSMLCRGYGRASHMYVTKKPLCYTDRIALGTILPFIICYPLLVYLL